MTAWGQTIRTGVATAVLLTGLAGGARGFAPGGGGAFGGGVRSAVQMRAIVLCTGCSLEDVRKARPDERQLYELRHRRGQVVMQLRSINNAQMWGRFIWPPQIWVRAKDGVFQQLSAEENLLKEVEIVGLLNNSHTLDIFTVTIRG